MTSVARALFVVVVTAVLNYAAFQEKYAGTSMFWAVAAIAPLLFSVWAVLLARRDGDLRRLFHMRGGDVTLGILGAGVAVAAAVFVTRQWMPLGTPRANWVLRIYLQFGGPAELRARVGVITTLVVVVSAAEEIVWRYLVPRLLEDYVGTRRAWIYAWVLYALAHAPAAFALSAPRVGPNPLLPLAALGCGLVWACLARFTGRLLPSVVAHAFFACIILLFYRLYGPSL
jgi:membrane protease YdiL (CAAX protease family)